MYSFFVFVLFCLFVCFPPYMAYVSFFILSAGFTDTAFSVAFSSSYILVSHSLFLCAEFADLQLFL